jgi:putative transposase
MSEHTRKSHNVNMLLYHLVCPAKNRRKVFSSEVEKTLIKVCSEIAERYEIRYVEIGADEDHVHFLIQSVPMMLPKRLAQITKSITAREIFKNNPEVKKMLWGGAFWTSGYYINTVGLHGNEETIANYVKNQGKSYKQLYRGQLNLFGDGI